MKPQDTVTMQNGDVAAFHQPPSPNGSAPTSSPAAKSEAVLQASTSKPVIFTGRHLDEITQEAFAAMADYNQPPRLFHGAQGLVTIACDQDGDLFLRPATLPIITRMMSEAALWYNRKIRDGNTWTVPVYPPRMVAQIYLDSSPWPGVPPIKGLVTAPVVAAGGSICLQPGYDAASKLWMALPPGFSLPEGFLERPVEEDEVVGAREFLLDHLLGEVAFADQASRAHALGLMLLPFVRLLIEGPTPLHLIDAPTRSSGKTYLAEICIQPFAEPHKSTIKGDEEEWRKAIMAGLLSGRSHFLFDNNTGRLSSPSLAAAITGYSGKHTERALGSLQEVSASVRCVWVTTSNNAILDPDAASRCVMIRLDTQLAQPDARRYRHNPRRFIREHRGEVVAALLTLARYWLEQGRPSPEAAPQCRFPEWREVVGGILASAGVPGFLENLDLTRSLVDTEATAWTDFVALWAQNLGEMEVTVADLLPVALEIPDMMPYLGDREGRAQVCKFGKALARHRDRVFGGFKIVFRPAGGHKACYHLEPVGPVNEIVEE